MGRTLGIRTKLLSQILSLTFKNYKETTKYLCDSENQLNKGLAVQHTSYFRTHEYKLNS